MKGFHRQRSSEETLSHSRTPVPHEQSRWHDFWGEARTRILVWYIVILALSFGIAIPAFRQLLFARVDARFREDMAGELQDFKELLSGTVDLAKLENNRIRDNAQNTSRGNQPLSDSEKQLIQDLQIPSNIEETKRFFDAYLSIEIPEDNIFLLHIFLLLLWMGNSMILVLKLCLKNGWYGLRRGEFYNRSSP